MRPQKNVEADRLFDIFLDTHKETSKVNVKKASLKVFYFPNIKVGEETETEIKEGIDSRECVLISPTRNIFKPK